MGKSTKGRQGDLVATVDYKNIVANNADGINFVDDSEVPPLI